MKWLEGGLLLSLVVSTGAFAATTQTPDQAAASIDTAVKQKLGTGDGLQQNAINPFLDHNVNLKTIDNSKEGNVQFLNGSTHPFVVLSIIPASTGDLSAIVVNEDLDMDGNMDYSFTASGVSGICNNGVIKCDPGTWNNCTSWKWNAPDGKVILEATEIKELAGCFCINSFCGKNLALLNLPVVLESMGGAVVASILKWDSRYAISNVGVSDGTISYYGRKLEGTPNSFPPTGTPPNGYVETSGTTQPSTFSSNPDSIGPAADAELQKQQLQPNSFYTLLSNSKAAADSQRSKNSCSVIRTVQTHNTQNYCAQPAPDNELREKQVYYYWKMLAASGGSQNDGHPCQVGADWGYKLNSWGFSPGIETCDATPVPPAGVYNQTSQMLPYLEYLGLWADMFDYQEIDGDADYSAYYLWKYYQQCVRYSDILDENISDGCMALENNDKCQLVDETIDGVVDLINGRYTGFNQMASCNKISGSLADYQICRDWWKKNRTYSCKNESNWDLSGGIKRMNSIQSTTDLSSLSGQLSMSYTDLRKNADGSWITENKTANLGAEKQYSDCEMACKTQKNTAHSDVAIAGTPAAFVKDISSSSYSFKACNPTCPVASDEVIVTDCKCIDEFADAISALQTLQKAKDDTICSQE